ncbi:MAG: DNA translocase FtsK [Geobacteraceae bacterium]|nr:FtsK/SpoIIIE domain-containing protein [Desulfuromonadaceae bacterium]NTV49256.1 DNA translocase FtsK [Geobacteraceae bacterium]NTW78734.1 DNA translocase FtsK [Geobacteraceae bacterium]
MSQAKIETRFIGMVAYRLLKGKIVSDQSDLLPEGNMILSRFEKDMVAALVNASEADGDRPKTLRFCLNREEMKEFDLETRHLTDVNAVEVRGWPTNGYFYISSEFEHETQSSGSTSSLEAQDLEERANACHWVEAFKELSPIVLHERAFGSPDQDAQAIALVQALFSLHRVSLSVAALFLWEVFKGARNDSLQNLAGRHLPILSVPRFDKLFDKVIATQPSGWSKKLESHWRNESYLRKRDDRLNLLETQDLEEALQKYEEDGPLQDQSLREAFLQYASSKPERSPASKNLFLTYDWPSVSAILSRQKKKVSQRLGEATKRVFTAEGLELNIDDEDMLDRLDTKRKLVDSDEMRDFFDQHRLTLEVDPSVYRRWEKEIYDKEITCEDLFQGIIECLEQSSGGSEYKGRQLSILLIGHKQNKPNNFKSMNFRACKFFEHQYKQLETFLPNLIFFKETLTTAFTEKVLPHIQKKNSSSKVANSFEFTVRIQAKEEGTFSIVSEHKLTWRFPLWSVYSEYLEDLDRLAENVARSALIECHADRDAAGAKGVPAPISLLQTAGFQTGASGKGSFVPAKSKAKSYSLVSKWKKEVDEALQQGTISSDWAAEAKVLFDRFNGEYTGSIRSLATSELFPIDSDLLADLFGSLVEYISKIPNESHRRRLLKPVMQIGVVQIPPALGEGSATIVCPWHPLRLQASFAQRKQLKQIIMQLLSPNRGEYCDETGSLFFADTAQLFSYPLCPEVSISWEGIKDQKPVEHVVSHSFVAYSLHEYPFSESKKKNTVHDDPKKAAVVVRSLVEEYLRLQPHEQDNLSVALYNSDSYALPLAVLEEINKLNLDRNKIVRENGDTGEINCQVVMTHRDTGRLRDAYKTLLSHASGPNELLGTEVTGDFLSRVRINIIAAANIPSFGSSKPIDIVLCQDVVSRLAKPDWHRIHRTTLSSQAIMPHQWGRREPVAVASDVSRLYLTCPAQTSAGWQYLLAVAALFKNEAIDSWINGQCHILARKVDFSEEELGNIFTDTHRLGAWVANYDELLDRRLLEERGVKVIRYEQNATHGRNLVISSKDSNAFLEATLREKIADVLGVITSDEIVSQIVHKLMVDATQLSGGLVLKAARRLRNAQELIGCVLSKFILEQQIADGGIGTAWCMLDDYARWLGKRPETGIADILSITPVIDNDGRRYLEVLVSEAKYIDYASLPAEKKRSESQLIDSVKQLQRAIDTDISTLDGALILARLSEILANNLRSQQFIGAESWKTDIREGNCSIRVRGYSHIFCHGPKDNLLQRSQFTMCPRAGKTESYQEIFNHQTLAQLLRIYAEEPSDAPLKVRQIRLNSDAILKEIEGVNPNNSRVLLIKDPITSNQLAHDDLVKPLSTPEKSSEEVSIVLPIGSTDITTKVPDVNTEKTLPKPACVREELLLSSPIFELLSSKAESYNDSSPETVAWSVEMAEKTRSAFIRRGMAFHLDCDPILSPNALIFKIKGSSEVTEAIINRYRSEIKTTDALDILSVVGEVGRISIAVQRSPRAVLHSTEMFSRYLLEVAEGKAAAHDIPVAVREDDNSLVYLKPFEQPHSLVAGSTGSGKSVLLRNIVAAICLAQKPDEAQVILIDAKGGLDFNCLYPLPHIVEYNGNKLVDDQNVALELLVQINEEMDQRYALFKEHVVDNLTSYRKKTGKKLPIHWIIFDEFGIWVQDDEFRKAIEPLINTIAKKARAAGIFLVLADQRPDNRDFPMQTRSNLSNRLALKVADKGTSKIALEEEGAENLLKHGHMLAKTADYPYPVYCQVPYINTEDMYELAETIASQAQQRIQDSMVPE